MDKTYTPEQDATARAVASGPATPHPDWIMGSPLWTRVRACHDGADAVKASRTLYLPQPDGMFDEQYARYLMRASFLPVVGRTETALSGLLLQEDPEVAAPTDVLAITEDITLTDQSVAGFAQETVTELLVAGRVAVVVDISVPEPGGIRPYWCLRDAESMIFWREEAGEDGGPGMLTRVVFREDALVESEDDEYRLVVEHRIREYVLESGRLAVQVFALRKGKWILIERSVPLVYGEPLDMIPVLIANALSLGPRVVPPPLLPIADLALSHYRSSADLEQGNYYASMPTAWLSGARQAPGTPGQRQRVVQAPQDQTHGLSVQRTASAYRLGSGKIIELPAEAKIGYLEIAGPGLDSIHRTLERKEDQLQAVGAQLVQDQHRQPETATTARTRAKTESAMLRRVASVADQLLSNALGLAASWMGHVDADVSVTLDRTLLDEEVMQPQPDLAIDHWPEG